MVEKWLLQVNSTMPNSAHGSSLKLSLRDCKHYFKWPFIYKESCLIYNGTL